MSGDIKEREFELKRIEAAAKVMENAIERQFKLASFGLAGNIGAIGASSLAFKDYRINDKKHEFGDAVFWFFLGAIMSTVALGIASFISEILAYSVNQAIAANPSDPVKNEFFSFSVSDVAFGIGMLVFVGSFAFSAWCFFYGVHRLLPLVQ